MKEARDHCLAKTTHRTHIALVNQIRPVRPRRVILRSVLTGVGALLIIVAPIVGAVPGPGGVLVGAAGLAMMLQNSEWAKRLFVRLKRRWPGVGKLADLGLRRASAQRRFKRDSPVGKDGRRVGLISRLILGPIQRLVTIMLKFIRGRVA